MQQSILEMAKDLVKAQIQAGQLTPDTMDQALQESFSNLTALQASEDQVTVGVTSMTGRSPRSITWRQSITQHVITCLECGAIFKQLSIRHLREHDLTARSYRDKYGIPKTQPLAAKATTARRRQVVQETRPWEKTPRYIATQAGKAETAKKSAAKRGK